MNKSQLIVLWIGVLVFLFCLWNPKIMPYTRYEKRMEEYTDKKWERTLSRFNLSLADSKESLRDKKSKLTSPRDAKFGDINDFNEWWKTIDDEIKAEYIDMLLRGEKPSRMVKVAHTYFTRPFETDSDALFVRLLSVTVLTSLLIYSYSDKNRATLKAILQPFIRWHLSSVNLR